MERVRWASSRLPCKVRDDQRRKAVVVEAYTEQRDHLLQSIEQDDEKVRVAMHELAGAARFKLDVGEHIKQFPLTWVIGACLVGAWLGSRRGR
jgi:hypothetical protein